MKEIFIATGNQHKVEEYRKMFSSLDVQVKSVKDIGETLDVEETGSTFEENAIIKAEYFANKVGHLVISDDSGLVIDALNGEPGIYSARYLGEDTSYDYKNSVILERMNNATNRSCRFVCAIALAGPGIDTQVFVGKIEGQIAEKIGGVNGFGYDPIFFVPEIAACLAEINDEEKNKISHRGKACEKLVRFLNEM